MVFPTITLEQQWRDEPNPTIWAKKNIAISKLNSEYNMADQQWIKEKLAFKKSRLVNEKLNGIISIEIEKIGSNLILGAI
jgi:hypothetical protein